MDAKEAQEHVRRKSIACPCCGHPLMLAVGGATPNAPEAIAHFIEAARQLRDRGLLLLVPAEIAAQEIEARGEAAIPKPRKGPAPG